MVKEVKTQSGTTYRFIDAKRYERVKGEVVKEHECLIWGAVATPKAEDLTTGQGVVIAAYGEILGIVRPQEVIPNQPLFFAVERDGQLRYFTTTPVVEIDGVRVVEEPVDTDKDEDLEEDEAEEEVEEGE